MSSPTCTTRNCASSPDDTARHQIDTNNVLCAQFVGLLQQQYKYRCAQYGAKRDVNCSVKTVEDLTLQLYKFHSTLPICNPED